MPSTTQQHAHRAGECARCYGPRPAGHDRYCPGCLPLVPSRCSTTGCFVPLPRRPDGTPQTCDGCRDQAALFDMGPEPRAAKEPAA